MFSDPRQQQKEGTNQDVSLTNTDENVIESSLDENPSTNQERTEETENTSLTQLVKDDGEITSDFKDGDDRDFDVE